jgi:outer membrane autotransporter protein
LIALSALGLPVAAQAQSITSTGTVTPPPPSSGSTWAPAADIDVGSSISAGTLTASGGFVISDPGKNLGIHNASTATLTGTGTKLILGSAGIVVVAGGGTFNLSSGADLEGKLQVGYNDAGGFIGTATAIIDGATVGATTQADLAAGGNSSSGTITIRNGSVVNLTAFVVGSGGNASSQLNGIATIDNSTVSVSGYIGIGSGYSNGTLNVQNSAVMGGLGVFLVGNGTGSATGVVNVNSGGAITAAGNTIIGNSSTGGGTLNLSQGGKFTANGSFTLGNTATSAGVVNIGGAPTGAAAASGTLVTSSIVGGPGSGTINFNITDTSYAFAPSITGNAGVNQIAGSTKLTGANTYTRATNVNGGTLLAGSASAFSANSAFTVASLGTLDLNGVNQTVASLNNAGAVKFSSGAPGTKLTVTGAYTGAGGTLALRTALGDDSSATDQLVVGGASTGNTTLAITNVSGAGALTTNGIQVVNVTGASTGTFTLAGGPLYAGAYKYLLQQGSVATPTDGDWYLQSQISSAAQVDGLLGSSLASFGVETLGDIAERLGTADASPDLPNADSDPWIRVGGSNGTFSANAGGTYAQSTRFVQSGMEGVAMRNADGSHVAGFYGDFGSSSTSLTTSTGGTGSINSSFYGLGAHAGWTGKDGLYADAVGQVTVSLSNISSDTGGTANDVLGGGYAASIEAGKKIALGDGWTVVPQGQLVLNATTFAGYTDSNNLTVSNTIGRGLLGRAGVRIEKLGTITTPDGTVQKVKGYASANLNYNFLDASLTNVAGTMLPQGGRQLGAELGVGATYSVTDKVSFRADADYSATLTNGTGHAWKGALGLNVIW